jgi:hypothetical protein
MRSVAEHPNFQKRKQMLCLSGKSHTAVPGDKSHPPQCNATLRQNAKSRTDGFSPGVSGIPPLSSWLVD